MILLLLYSVTILLCSMYLILNFSVDFSSVASNGGSVNLVSALVVMAVRMCRRFPVHMEGTIRTVLLYTLVYVLARSLSAVMAMDQSGFWPEKGGWRARCARVLVRVLVPAALVGARTSVDEESAAEVSFMMLVADSKTRTKRMKMNIKLI